MTNGKTVMIPLLIEKYLRLYSDPDHPLSIMEMQRLLEEAGRKADRRTIYASLEALKENGVKIAIVSNKLDSAVKELNKQFFAAYTTSAIGEMDGVAH